MVFCLISRNSSDLCQIAKPWIILPKMVSTSVLVDENTVVKAALKLANIATVIPDSQPLFVIKEIMAKIKTSKRSDYSTGYLNDFPNVALKRLTINGHDLR